MTDPGTARDGQLSHREILVIFGALLAGLFLSALDQTIVSTALPTIVGDIGGFDELSWVFTAYLLTSTTSTPLFGKLGDIFGRKGLYQIAIITFVGGSILCGLAQNMIQLIVFRGIQGIGAGGLTAMAFAIMADIISPRARGRYSGYLGAQFALATVVGPVLGGFFVDYVSWRWIFFVNVPIGVAALIATSSALRLPFARRRHRIDFGGAALLTIGTASLLLALEWGGNRYPWGSAMIVSLGAVAVTLLAAFIFWETRVAEPILPLRLFRDSIFSLNLFLSILVGATMYGAIVFLPLFQQAVVGASATNSGLLLLPLMLGITGTSIVIGRVITTTGRYKVWPIASMGVAALGMWLLSRMDSDTGALETSAYMFVLGLGLGMGLQVMTLTVQNAVSHRDIGVATSAVNFFRSMGGAVGTAVFGVIFTSRLSDELVELLPSNTTIGSLDLAGLASNPETIRALPGPVATAFIEAMSHSIGTVFLVVAAALIAGFVAAWFLREIPLSDKTHIGRVEARESAPLLRDDGL